MSTLRRYPGPVWALDPDRVWVLGLGPVWALDPDLEWESGPVWVLGLIWSGSRVR